jgi:hypothetical protein
MGHRVNRHIVLVFVSFLLAGLVLTASGQMASGPIEPGAGTWQECLGTGERYKALGRAGKGYGRGHESDDPATRLCTQRQ